MHSAVWANKGKLSSRLIKVWGFTLVILIFAGLVASTKVSAQSTNQSSTSPSDNNLSEANLEESAVPVRRIQRLGDVVGEQEWEPDWTVPRVEGRLPYPSRLPNEKQQQELQLLLTMLAKNPNDSVATAKLSGLLDDVMRQAKTAIDNNEPSTAQGLLGVVLAVNPDHPGIEPAKQRLNALGEIEGQLKAARNAVEEGRIDQPETNSAWFFYRRVLDQQPDNLEAQEGLVVVQKHLIFLALDRAREMDFDSAERLLEDASFVREEQNLVDEARGNIDLVKSRRAQMLETRAVKAMDGGDFDGAERLLIDLVALGGQGNTVNSLRRRLEEARVYGGFKPGQEIRDHFKTTGTWAPESVVILAGSFMMGSLPEEAGRAENEGPQHRVTFRRGFAIGKKEVTVGEFKQFVNQSGYKADSVRAGRSTVYDHYSGRLTEKEDVDWEQDYEGKPAKSNNPVVHVSWNDAQAYVNWLARGTGKSYRLPTEAEFEYAQRGGRNTRYWWGNNSPSGVVENLTGDGDNSRSRRRWSVAFSSYEDKFWGPAPVASFSPNPYQLYDIAGNVGEWVRDCWHDTYIRAPMDGSVWINPGCEQRVIRGGYWASSPDQTRSAHRLFAKPDHHDARIGFRIARDL
jgi:formylglycine-generating enzyme required for sulfatase activity